MKDTRGIRLVLFLSRATSLQRWDRLGILERELKYYRELSRSLAGVSVVTPGGSPELQFSNQLGRIDLLVNRRSLPPNFFSLVAPIQHRTALRSASILKSNQLDGAWTAVMAGQLHRKPVIVRAGYLWSVFVRSSQGSGLKTWMIQCLERFTLKNSTAIFATTESLRARLTSELSIPGKRIHVIPNYVDTELFKPQASRRPKYGRIGFIGRLHPQKNLKELLGAVSKIPGCSLVVAGEGDQRPELEKLANEYQVEVEFTGILQHSQLPELINSCQIFILPSLYEGHPKALLEAMACGLPVIGTNVNGIKELVVHKQTGLICGTDKESIRASIQELLAEPDDQQRLGTNARSYVIENFSLTRVLDLELTAIASIVAHYGQN